MDLTPATFPSQNVHSVGPLRVFLFSMEALVRLRFSAWPGHVALLSPPAPAFAPPRPRPQPPSSPQAGPPGLWKRNQVHLNIRSVSSCLTLGYPPPPPRHLLGKPMFHLLFKCSWLSLCLVPCTRPLLVAWSARLPSELALLALPPGLLLASPPPGLLQLVAGLPTLHAGLASVLPSPASVDSCVLPRRTPPCPSLQGPSPSSGLSWSEVTPVSHCTHEALRIQTNCIVLLSLSLQSSAQGKCHYFPKTEFWGPVL